MKVRIEKVNDGWLAIAETEPGQYVAGSPTSPEHALIGLGMILAGHDLAKTREDVEAIRVERNH